MAKAFLVVRICGQPDVPYWATTTMSLLKLEKRYRATIMYRRRCRYDCRFGELTRRNKIIF